LKKVAAKFPEPLIVCFAATNTGGQSANAIKSAEYLCKSETRMQERTCQEGDTIRALPGYAMLEEATKWQVNEALNRFDSQWTKAANIEFLTDGSHRVRGLNEGGWIERHWQALGHLLQMLESGDSRFETDISRYFLNPKKDNGKTSAWLYYAAGQLVDLAGAKASKARLKQAETALRRLLAHSDFLIDLRVKASKQGRKGGTAKRGNRSNEKQTKTAKLALKKQVVEIVRGRDHAVSIKDFMDHWRHNGHASSESDILCEQCSDTTQLARFRFTHGDTEIEIPLSSIQQEGSKTVQ
jgi:hypothetical protein